jgi:trigger factor
MTATLSTTVTELPESRVRLQVQVPPDELEKRLELRASQLGRQLKLPGFRRGKVPAPLVIQRVGREAILEEAVRDTLSSWYADAIQTSGIVPVGDPEVDLGDLPSQGGTLEFSIEIGVLPTAQLGDYKGLEVARAEPQVGEEQIGHEIDGLRERLARLESVQRPAENADFVVIDYLGSIDGEPFPGGEGRDQLVELGSGNLIPGFEEALIGAAAGETRTIELTFPADYGHEPLAGRPASFEVTVKEVKHKQLPEVGDDLAIDAGFDDLGELRADIRTRLLEVEERRVQGQFAQDALDAAVAAAKVPTTEALSAGRAREMWERMLHSLSHRGVTREAYLQISGRSEEEILAEMQPEAEQALRREAVLNAIVQAEGISPSEQDVLEALAPTAAREGTPAEELVQELRKAGRLEEVREDLAARQAVELLAAEAKPISVGQAEARERIWTPEKDEEQHEVAGAGAGPAAGRLWTPTDQGSSS